MPEFNHVDLVVADVRRSVEFYRRLGLEIPDENVWEHNGRAHHVEVKLASGTTIGLDSPEMTHAYDGNWPAGAPGAVFVFSVPDREAVDKLYYEMIGEGSVAHMPPIDAFWGARYAIVDDPDGNHVGLMSPSDQEHKSAPGF
jgi:catechol 2,3-dioxygenase-like lactoylglutathione lyase family enzyme